MGLFYNCSHLTNTLLISNSIYTDRRTSRKNMPSTKIPENLKIKERKFSRQISSLSERKKEMKERNNQRQNSEEGPQWLFGSRQCDEIAEVVCCLICCPCFVMSY